MSQRELASRTGITEWTFGRIVRGIGRPSDKAKIAIARETLAIEKELGAAEPRGIAILDWFEEMLGAAVDGDDAQAAG